MSVKDKRTEIDLSGAIIEIDGEEHAVESGKAIFTVEHLYAPDDDPNDPTEVIVRSDISVETIGDE